MAFASVGLLKKFYYKNLQNETKTLHRFFAFSLCDWKNLCYTIKSAKWVLTSFS